MGPSSPVKGGSNVSVLLVPPKTLSGGRSQEMGDGGGGAPRTEEPPLAGPGQRHHCGVAPPQVPQRGTVPPRLQGPPHASLSA